MPTGYTSKLHDGKKPVTFREFAMDCSRAFGALLHMRDEDQDAKITLREVGEYYPKRIKEIEVEIARLQSLTPDVIEAEHAAHLKTLADDAAKARERSDAMRARYEAMLAEVKAWTPPSPDHVEIKKFMAEQIESSIKFDCECGSSYYDDKVKAAPRSAVLWHKERIEAEYEALKNASRHLAEERQRVFDANNWVLALMESLPKESD